MSLPQSQSALHGKGLTTICCGAPKYNEAVMLAIIEACMTSLDESAEGKELSAIRVALTAPIYELLGSDRGTEFENLTARLVLFYGHEMFRLGLEIGRNPSTIFTLPESENE